MNKFFILLLLGITNFVNAAEVRLRLSGTLLGSSPRYYCPSESEANDISEGSIDLEHQYLFNGYRYTIRARPRDIYWKRSITTSSGQVHKPLSQATFKGWLPTSRIKFGNNRICKRYGCNHNAPWEI